MIILSLLSMVLCLVFLLTMMWKNKGVLESISSTAYIAGHKLLFTLILLFVGGLLFPAMLEKSSEGTQFLAFLMIVGLGIVAITPDYRTTDGLQHNIGGVACCVCSQILIATNQPGLLVLWLPCLVYLLFGRDKNYTFWVEMTCMAIVYSYCLS